MHMDYENGRFLIGINRIRLEFKDNDGAQKSLEQQGINRIRLEFKGHCSVFGE